MAIDEIPLLQALKALEVLLLQLCLDVVLGGDDGTHLHFLTAHGIPLDKEFSRILCHKLPVWSSESCPNIPRPARF